MYVSYDIDTRTPYVEGHGHGTLKVKYWTMWELPMVNHSHVRKQQHRICQVQVSLYTPCVLNPCERM